MLIHPIEQTSLPKRAPMAGVHDKQKQLSWEILCNNKTQ